MFAAVCCAMVALSGGAARCQESTRVPETKPDAGAAVDASVHASVEPQSAEQPQHLRQPSKRQQTRYIQWALQPANRPSSTPFQPDQASSLVAQPGRGNEQSAFFDPLTRSETSRSDILGHGQNTPFGISPLGAADPQTATVRGLLRNLNSESGTPVQSFKAKNTVPSPYLRNNEFSTALGGKTIEPAEKSSFASPFPKQPGSLQRQSKKHPQAKSVGQSRPASLLDSLSTKKD